MAASVLNSKRAVENPIWVLSNPFWVFQVATQLQLLTPLFGLIKYLVPVAR
jgi:hypothetical protein